MDKRPGIVKLPHKHVIILNRVMIAQSREDRGVGNHFTRCSKSVCRLPWSPVTSLFVVFAVEDITSLVDHISKKDESKANGASVCDFGSQRMF